MAARIFLGGITRRVEIPALVASNPQGSMHRTTTLLVLDYHRPHGLTIPVLGGLAAKAIEQFMFNQIFQLMRICFQIEQLFGIGAAADVLVLPATNHQHRCSGTFGQVFADAGVWIVGIIAVTMLSLFRRAVVINLFDSEVAASLGIRTRLLDYASFAMRAQQRITDTMRFVGNVKRTQRTAESGD